MPAYLTKNDYQFHQWWHIDFFHFMLCFRETPDDCSGIIVFEDSSLGPAKKIFSSGGKLPSSLSFSWQCLISISNFQCYPLFPILEKHRHFSSNFRPVVRNFHKFCNFTPVFMFDIHCTFSCVNILGNSWRKNKFNRSHHRLGTSLFIQPPIYWCIHISFYSVNSLSHILVYIFIFILWTISYWYVHIYIYSVNNLILICTY